MSLWEWITGGSGQTNLRATPAPTAAAAAAPASAASAASPPSSAVTAAATPAPSNALVPVSTALAPAAAAAPAPAAAAAAPVDGFWGFTSDEGVHADNDVALDDMLQFYVRIHLQL